jgi:hypothetical protein
MAKARRPCSVINGAANCQSIAFMNELFISERFSITGESGFVKLKNFQKALPMAGQPSRRASKLSSDSDS